MFVSARESVDSFVASTFAGPPPRGLPALPPVARLSPLVVRVVGMNPSAFTLQGTNTYLVGRGPTRWLVDSGEGKPAYVPELRRALEAEGVTRLAGILLTHWHHDHVGGVADVRALLADVMATAAEKNASSEKNASDVVPAYKRVRRDKGERSIPLSAPAEAHRAPRTYVDLEDGQILDAVPGATLRVSLTPGHAEDHACFELVEEGSVFAGDCVVNGTTANFEDLAAYSASLERMAKELEASKANAEAKCAEAKRRARRSSEDDDARDDDDAAAAVDDSCVKNVVASEAPAFGRLYPSHGDVIADGSKKLEEYRAHRSRREENFVEELRAARTREPERGGLTCWELCRRTYGASVPWLVLHHACAPITRQHLAKLVEEGRVVEERGAGLARLWRAAKYTPSEEEMKKTKPRRETTRGRRA